MIGMLLATQFFALMIMQPVFGFIADRVGKKPVILISMSVFAAGCYLMAGAPAIAYFAAGLFITGMGYGISESLTCAALVDIYQEKSERYANLSQSLFSLGAVAGPLVAKQIPAAVNTRLVFLITACGFLILLPFFYMTPLPGPSIVKEKTKFNLRGGAATPFILLLLTIFLYGVMETAAGGFFNSLFSIALSAPQFGAYAISIFWLGMGLSRIVFGLVRISAKRVVAMCMLGCMVTFAVLGFSHSPAISLLLCAIAGFSTGPVWAMLVSFAAKEYPAYSGTAVALMSTFGGLGATLGPIAIGWAAEYYSLHTAMILISVTVLIGIVVFNGYLRKGEAKNGKELS